MKKLCMRLHTVFAEKLGPGRREIGLGGKGDEQLVKWKWGGLTPRAKNAMKTYEPNNRGKKKLFLGGVISTERGPCAEMKTKKQPGGGECWRTSGKEGKGGEKSTKFWFKE